MANVRSEARLQTAVADIRRLLERHRLLDGLAARQEGPRRDLLEDLQRRLGLAYLFIVALAIWDSRTRGALHPVTRWGGLALIVSLPVRLALSGTAAWLAFAAWLTGLAR